MLVDWLVVDRYITTRIRYLPFLLDLIMTASYSSSDIFFTLTELKTKSPRNCLSSRRPVKFLYDHYGMFSSLHL